MRVRMLVAASGARNGKPWPRRGEVVDLPDEEAAGYCAAGLAEPVAEPDGPVETATMPAPETRAGTAGDGAAAVTTATGPVKRGRASAAQSGS